jgi:hypothetical protein
MLISKAFYRHLPIFLNLFKCPLRAVTGTQKKLGFWVGFWVFHPTQHPNPKNPKNPKPYPTPKP